MHPQAAYDELLRRYRELGVLASCVALLEWDELTYMPTGGIAARGQHLSYLAGMQHEKATDPRFGELLDVVEDSSLVQEPSSAPGVNVREMRRNFDRLVRIPRALVEEMAGVAVLSQQQWTVARRRKDFKIFQPWLEKVVALKRQQAQCIGGGSGDPYDALLNEYEPGAESAAIAQEFQALGQELRPLLDAILGSGRKPRLSILKRIYPIDRQEAFCQEVAETLGFDFQRGRIDTAVHPFCTNVGAGDCRIATRFSAKNFGDAFFATLHEVGHALYEQGLDPAHEGTPLGEATSVAMHESQSRLWENHVGRSLSFWTHFFPRARETFPEALKNVDLADFHFAVNHVEPSLNRVQADEVTYNLHILIRFELERALIRGDLTVGDLPAAWNEAYRRHLGIEPQNDAEGCLQDGHWSEGLIGYFPTYTLGNLFAAQLVEAAHTELGSLDEQFSQGHFDDLLNWLRKNVHRQGSRYAAIKLVEHASGRPPQHRPLVEAMWRKYGELYGLDRSTILTND